MTGGPPRDADRIEPGTAVALIAMGLGVIVIAAVLGFLISLFFVGGRLRHRTAAGAERP